jgi:hypothetical protein
MGELVLMRADEPYNDEHYQCVLCDGTFTKQEIEEVGSKQEITENNNIEVQDGDNQGEIE